VRVTGSIDRRLPASLGRFKFGSAQAQKTEVRERKAVSGLPAIEEQRARLAANYSYDLKGN
jgi:hypothetical protein